MRRNKRGFGGIEYVIIGTVLLVASLGIIQFWVPESKDNVKTGSENLSDNTVRLENNAGTDSYIATGLEVFPTDVALLINETKDIGATVTPTNLWTIPLSWSATTADLEIFEIIPTTSKDAVQIKGLREGKALLNVRTTDGSNLSRDVIVRVGKKADSIEISGEANIRSDQPGTLTVNFNDPGVTWNNKTLTWVIKQGEELIEVEESANSLIIKPKSGGTVKVLAVVEDLVYDQRFEAEFTINIQQIWSEWSTTQTNNPGEETKKQYRSLAYTVWSENYSTPYGQPGEVKNPDGTYKTALSGYGSELNADPDPDNPLVYRDTQYRVSTYVSKATNSTTAPDSSTNRVKNSSTATQYGYQTATAFSSTYTTTKPTYYTSRTEYKVNWSKSVTTSYDCSTTYNTCSQVDSSCWNQGWSDQWNCPGGTVWGCWNYKTCTKQETQTGTTDWQTSDSSVPSGCSKTGINSTRTTYAEATTFSASTGWRTSGAYTQTATQKPVTRTVYSYEYWIKYPSTYTACPNHVCPTNDSTHEYEFIRKYKNPIYASWSSWDWEEKIQTGNGGGLPSVLVEDRNMYRYPINLIS